ncbi:unnamed protein product [Rhizoctonia solani]|uniref:F-box domain-containing protein n=1 Tax=Rhizoctonia solani TaxID=456999 RepID=A0A8H3HRM9_9AGAM|nr:unnamed protein product [Rhizoctonia solani]
MPPEVFTEIATHLLPADMLALSRSNKFFRNLFMSRTSQRFWQSAISNVLTLPPCPPDLNEPQYISLIYSKTCSNCGARVLRRMDPYLHVRLCNPCCDKVIMEMPLNCPLIQFLPRSSEIRVPPPGCVHTLQSEFAKIKDAAKKYTDEDAFAEWQRKTFEEIRERQTHGLVLESFLSVMEEEREIELYKLKCQREAQIKTRLQDEGWSTRDMEPSPTNRMEWNKLVSQPKLITNRIWANLYPKLLPLLGSNRVYNDLLDKEARRGGRVRKLHTLVSTVQKALPPLVSLQLKHSSEDIKPSKSSACMSAVSEAVYSSLDYPGVKIAPPFPTMAEFLTWPMIKRLVDNDMSLEDVETRFEEIRDEFDAAVVEWRDKVERDLVEIWNADWDAEEGNPSTSNKERNPAKTEENANGPTVHNRNSATNSAHGSADFVLPEFVATYSMPDGTTTTNLSDLSPNLQLLLRADTIFDSVHFNDSYPSLLYRVGSVNLLFPDSGSSSFGERWDPSIIQRDEEGSAAANRLLARIGRSGASTAEMQALGERFRCGRCIRMPDTWEQLVQHYAAQQKQWKRAQVKIAAEPEFGFVFNNTHDPEPGNKRPVVHFMTNEAAPDNLGVDAIHNMDVMTCALCDGMGIQAEYYYGANSIEDPMKQHLHDVHGVMEAEYGVHFRLWEYNPEFSSSFGSDEGSYDGEEGWLF